MGKYMSVGIFTDENGSLGYTIMYFTIMMSKYLRWFMYNGLYVLVLFCKVGTFEIHLLQKKY